MQQPLACGKLVLVGLYVFNDVDDGWLLKKGF